MMIDFILGPPKSGKSEYAEKLMVQSSVRSKLYIGTLPSLYSYLPTIAEHRQRRPPDWSLLELTADLNSDIESIRKALVSKCDILFDGLTFYVLRLFFSGMLPATENVLHNLCRIGQSRAQETVVVDCPISFALPKRIQMIMQATHAYLGKISAHRMYVENGKHREITQLDILKINHYRGKHKEVCHG